MHSADTGMLTYPLGNSMQVVIMAHRVKACGRALMQTFLFHGLQFFFNESGLPYLTPVVVVTDQVKAGGETAVGADQGTISSCPAVPGPHTAPHSFLKSLEVLDGVHHGPALTIFFNQPIQ